MVFQEFFSLGQSEFSDHDVLLVASCYRFHSDSAVKQILLSMNERNPFIIEDLDDFHLVIKADEEYRVRSELEAEVWTSFRHPSSLSISRYET